MTDTATTVYTVTRDPARSRDFEFLGIMTPALEDLANKIRRHLRLFNPHGVGHPRWALDDRIASLWPNDELTSDQVAYVMFWSSPSEDTPYGNIPSLFGREDLNPSEISSPFVRSDQAGTIPLLDDNGVYFGEIVGNAIYISFDLPHMGTAGEIMRLMVPRIAETFERSNDPVFLEELKILRMSSLEKTFVDACQGRSMLRSSSLQTAIDDAASRLTVLREDLIRAQTHYQDTLTEYKAAKIAEKLTSKDKDKYAREFAALLANKKIDDVDVTGQYLIIKTVDLTSTWLSDGTRRKLGVFEFKIPFMPNETGGYIYLRNLTNPHVQTGQPHPHARSETNICWGNLSTGVSLLQGQLEFGALAELVIKFLEEPNPDDPWGESVWAGWPNVVEKKSPDIEPRLMPERSEEDFCGWCDMGVDECECCYDCRDAGLDCGSYRGDCITYCEEDGDDHDCDLCPCA